MNASKKRRRSKTTELRPNNEDLGKNTGSLLIVWQAALQRSSSIFSSLLMPFTHFSQIEKGRKKKKQVEQCWLRPHCKSHKRCGCECKRRRAWLGHWVKFYIQRHLPANLFKEAAAIKTLRDQQTWWVQTASWNPEAARGRRWYILPPISTLK